MIPVFESEPPFIIKVYDRHFEVTWDGSMVTAEDSYRYEDIDRIEIIYGKKIETIPERILSYIFHTQLARKIEAYDEVHITFIDGRTEIRYVHGPATESMLEAIELIVPKLKRHRQKAF